MCPQGNSPTSRLVPGALSVVLVQLLLSLSLFVGFGAAEQISLRRLPSEASLGRRDVDYHQLFEPNNTVYLDHWDSDDEYNHMQTYTLTHDDLHYVHVERFEHLLRNEVGLCASRADTTALKLAFLNEDSFVAARQVWEHRDDLLFVLEDPTCFEGPEWRSVYRPYDIFFNAPLRTITIQAHAVPHPVDEMVDPKPSSPIDGALNLFKRKEDRPVWASRMQIRYGPVPNGVRLGHREVRVGGPTHKFNRRWTIFNHGKWLRKARDKIVNWWTRDCKNQETHPFCSKHIAPLLPKMEKLAYKVYEYWGVTVEDEDKWRQDLEAFIMEGQWAKNFTLKAENIPGLSYMEAFHFALPLTAFELMCSECHSAGELAVSWNLDLDILGDKSKGQGMDRRNKFIQQHMKAAHMRVEVVEDIHTHHQLSAVFPNGIDLLCSVTVAALSRYLVGNYLPKRPSCTYGVTAGGVFQNIDSYKGFEDMMMKTVWMNQWREKSGWNFGGGRGKFENKTEDTKKWNRHGYGFMTEPLDIVLNLNVNPIGVGAGMNLTFPGVEVNFAKGQYMEIDMLKDDKYVNTLDPQITILPPDFRTGVMNAHYSTSLSLGAGFKLGHDTWNQAISAGVGVDISKLTMTLGTVENVDIKCNPSTAPDKIDYGASFKVDFSAGVRAYASLLGFTATTDAFANPWFKDMCKGFAFCTNLYSYCFPCKYCIHGIINRFMETHGAWGNSTFKLSDVPMARMLVQPPEGMPDQPEHV